MVDSIIHGSRRPARDLEPLEQDAGSPRHQLHAQEKPKVGDRICHVSTDMYCVRSLLLLGCDVFIGRVRGAASARSDDAVRQSAEELSEAEELQRRVVQAGHEVPQTQVQEKKSSECEIHVHTCLCTCTSYHHLLTGTRRFMTTSGQLPAHFRL